jgi:hypothetical protein
MKRVIFLKLLIIVNISSFFQSPKITKGFESGENMAIPP